MNTGSFHAVLLPHPPQLLRSTLLTAPAGACVRVAFISESPAHQQPAPHPSHLLPRIQHRVFACTHTLMLLLDIHLLLDPSMRGYVCGWRSWPLLNVILWTPPFLPIGLKQGARAPLQLWAMLPAHAVHTFVSAPSHVGVGTSVDHCGFLCPYCVAALLGDQGPFPAGA